MINTVAATYTEPDLGGDAKATRNKSRAEYIAADDGQILKASPNFRLCRDNRQAQQFALSTPLLAVAPGLAIMITVVAINFIGDGLRDAFDPRQRRIPSKRKMAKA